MQLLLDTLAAAFVPLCCLAIGYLIRCHREAPVAPDQPSAYCTQTKKPAADAEEEDRL